MRHGSRALRRFTCGLACVGMVAAGAVTVASSTSGASVTKNVITFAEGAGAAPNYIFPYMPLSKFSVANVEQFQYFMFRPLYWVGTGNRPVISKRLSVAELPKVTNGNKTYTITFHAYKWSNGEAVDAQDIMFFLNIYHSAKTQFAEWTPTGLAIPTIIKSAVVVSPKTLRITLKRAVNPTWFLNNQLSALSPLPLAWTKTSATAAAGSAGCAKAAFGTKDSACHAVYTFLSEQSGFNPTKPSTTINALPTYATNPLWQVVDGPWHLKSFGPTEPVVMVPNPKYSGPNKPTIKEFIEKPFTTESAEFNALAGGTIDVGGLPFTEVTSPATAPSKPNQTTKTGKNNPRLAANFNLVASYRWGINYFPENYNSTADGGNAGPIFRQLYVRQAIQELLNQPLYINRIFRGYGVPTYGPVPVWPHNPFSSNYEAKNPYPYSPAKAKATLKSHGWKVVPNGVTTCQKPGLGARQCGKGIKRGAKLDFTLQYISGTKNEASLMAAEKSSWAQAGIKVNLSSATFDAVIGAATPCPKGCSWTMQNWGGGWIFTHPMPTGTEIFATGAGSNSGSFNTVTNNKLIKEANLSNVSLSKYENWLTKKLPVIWQPEIVTANEIHKGLVHPPLNPLDGNTPATFHWVK